MEQENEHIETEASDQDSPADTTERENDEREVLTYEGEQNTTTSEQRRYPLRNRIAKKYDDYVLLARPDLNHHTFFSDVGVSPTPKIGISPTFFRCRR